MSHSLQLSQIEFPHEIRAYFAWHRQKRVPLMLMFQSIGGPVSATLLDETDDCATLAVVCTGMGDFRQGAHEAYVVIGSTPGGANFLASGQMWAEAGTQDCFKLSFPQWIDISQSRDSFRCPTSGAHFFHFSALDPHLNDRVCRVENVSLGGLAVEWDGRSGIPPVLNEVISSGVLQSRDNRIQLGRLRVAHITPRTQGCVIGLDFENNVPGTFFPIVLAAQRSHYSA